MEHHYANLIRTATESEFYSVLADTMGSQLGVAAVSIYLLQRRAPPRARLQVMPDSAMIRRSLPLSAYTDWAYSLDPLYRHFDRGLPGGVYGLRQLMDQQLESTEFYQRFYRPVGGGDELVQLVALDAHRALGFYFVRSDHESAFTPSERAVLVRAEPILAEASKLHEKITAALEPGSALLNAWCLALGEFGVNRLSMREQEVVQCVLLGMSIDECASNLGLAPATVKNHRKAAYRKLDVRSGGELLTRFLTPAEPQDAAYSLAARRRQWLQAVSQLVPRNGQHGRRP